MKKVLFTSESVTEGHPDKISDKISDAILDEILRQDPNSRVACETFCTTGLVSVMGEITTEAYVDIQTIVRETVREIGYTGYVSDEYEKYWYPDDLPEPEIGMKHNLEFVKKRLLKD